MERDKKLIQQVTKNVYVETDMVACNLGLITTEDGVVLVDSPMKPTDALKWRDEVAKKGEVRYLINTEGHPDHATGVYFFPGAYISHVRTRERLAKTTLEVVKGQIKRNDPASISLVEDYRIRLADITFDGSLDLHLGGLTFRLFDLPGHVPGGIGVHIPEERVVFTGDIVFNKWKSWLSDSDPDKWLDSIKKIEALDVDVIVPGHGALCDKEYLKQQADIVRNWMDAVQSAVERGLSAEEAQTKVACPDPYPMQPGILMKESDVNAGSIKNLYAIGTRKRSGEKQ